VEAVAASSRRMRHVEPLDIRHADVEQDEIRLQVLRHTDFAGAIRRKEHVVPLEDHRHHREDFIVIFDGEDDRHFSAPLFPWPA